MSGSVLPMFAGKRVKHASGSVDPEAPWITFKDGASATIYNSCNLLEDVAHAIQGEKVIVEDWNTDRLRLEFGNGVSVEVDFRDAPWSSPEAIVYHSPTGDIVVVNEPPENSERYLESAS